jgi:hypothetical protein
MLASTRDRNNLSDISPVAVENGVTLGDKDFENMTSELGKRPSDEGPEVRNTNCTTTENRHFSQTKHTPCFLIPQAQNSVRESTLTQASVFVCACVSACCHGHACVD